jgi:zinc transport system ATP-binding protein
MALLKCESVSLGYDGKEILSDLNFSVNEGDYLCIVGENGSGKSTLMKTILGLHAPMKGKISTGDGLNRNEIGYLPQQTVVQKDFPASVWEVILSGRLNRHRFLSFYNKADKQLYEGNGNIVRRLEKLKELGIIPKKNIPESMLSKARE